MTNWPWPMEGVQTWFDNLWDWVSESAVNAVSVVSDWIWGAIEWLSDEIGELFTWVGGKIGDLYDDVVLFLTEGWAELTTAIGNVVGDVVDGVTELWAGFGEALAGIGEGFGTLWTDISTALTTGWEGLTTALSDTATWLGDKIGTSMLALTTEVTGFVTDAIMGGMDWVTNAMSGVARAIGDGLKDLFGWIMESLGNLAEGIVGAMDGIRRTVEPILSGLTGGLMRAFTSAIMPGSPDEEIEESVKEFTDAYMTRIMELGTSEKGSVPTLAQLLPRAAGIVALNLGAAVAGQTVGAALDFAHPAKDLGMQMIAMDLVNSVQMPAMVGPLMMGPVWSGVIVPLRYRFNEMNPTAVPDPRWLPDAAARGVLTEAEYRQAMKFHALDDSWASIMMASAYRTPGFPDLQLMYWRGEIGEADVGEALARQGLLPEMIPPYLKIMERIPGPGDLVRMAVREAFTRDELDVEFPGEFAAAMTKQGYAEIWSRFFWRAHWVLVPLGQLYEMFHRGLIDAGELSEQLKFHDYTPEWRDKLIALSWNLPGRIDARWLFRWGLIDMEELRELTIAQGVAPEWADRVAEATAKNQWLTEINRLRDNAKRRFVRGYDVEAQLRANLEGLGYPPEWIEFHIRDAVEDGELALKDDMVDALGAGYLKDLVKEDGLEIGLKAVIVRPQVVQMEMERLYIRKYVRPKAPTPEKVRVVPLSTLKRAFRDGIITESDFRAELVAREYGPVDIDMLVSIEMSIIAEEMKEMPAKVRVATLGTLRAAFREGLITETGLISELEARNYEADDIDLIVAVERVKIEAAEARDLAEELREEPEKVREATEGTLRMAFREGVLSEGELRSELEERGYDAEDIDLIVDVERTRMEEET